jgi:ATP-dependent helicase Lhr and Lhr-like helicase
VSADAIELEPVTSLAVFSDENLLHDVLASLNSTELAQRRFREIARVAGLVFTGYPGQPKSTRQLQASSGLFFEVFRKYDPGNLLLTQAQQEVLSQELELSRLRATLERLRSRRLEHAPLRHPSPMSVPLMVERFREQLSTEQLSARLDRILRDMERDSEPGSR